LINLTLKVAIQSSSHSWKRQFLSKQVPGVDLVMDRLINGHSITSLRFSIFDTT
jgi:hypothetical protein